MTADQPPVATSGDYRLADFKPLLPLGDGVRALVIATRERDFLPYLAADLGGIDLVDAPAAQAAADAAPQIWPESLGIRSLAEPAGPYDLVLSDQPSAARHLRPGGILCLFLGTARDSAAAPAELTALGRWRALPSWPAFRALIPDDGRGWRAATRDLHLLSVRSPAGIAARLRPGLAGRLLAERGIALYRRTGGAPAESLLAGLQGALAPQADAAPERRWLLTSGRLGPGNPILAFRLDEQGRPDYLIKIARFAGATHLQSEAEQLRAITAAVGPALAARIIRPLAATTRAGRAALAYRYEPTHPFFGLRWRLAGRAGLCHAMTDWLVALAQATRRQPSGAADETRHPDPLRRLVARRILPPAAQERAGAALADLERLAATLPTVLEHGDLGVYNLRLARADGRDFRVLDWGSSTLAGIPLGDLGYFLTSARAPAGLARRCLRTYLDGLGLPRAAARACWFSYLARRWAELDGIRPPVADDPTSGGGILLPIEARMAAYLDGLDEAPAGRTTR